MTAKLSRRRLLAYCALTGVGACAAYGTGWWWFKVRPGDTEDLIVSVLRRNLAGMAVAEEDMRAFAQEVQPRYSDQPRLAQLGILAPLYERFNVYRHIPRTAFSFRRFEDEVVGEFLFSSNFFDAGRNTADPIEYYGARDPKRRICSNLFANFDPE
jgi:hypothetical protein